MSRFQLPVVSTRGAVSADQLLRLSLRAEELHDATLGERVELEGGLAIVSDEFPDLRGANQVRDLHIPGDRTLAHTIADIEALFASRHRRCLSWMFEEGRVPPAARTLLESRGYVLAQGNLWRVASVHPLPERSDLSVIPVRASFEKLQALVTARYSGISEILLQQRREAVLRRLDDTAVDGLLALDGTDPVGMLILVTLGELGFITSFFVLPERRRQHAGATLLARGLDLAARSRLRDVTLFCDQGNSPAEALYRKAGLEVVARVESMEAAPEAAG